MRAGTPRLLAMMALVCGCSEDRWEGYVHPDRQDLGVYDYIGTYDNLESCRRMALMRLAFTPNPSLADYECGKNCRWQMTPGGVIKLCEATRR